MADDYSINAKITADTSGFEKGIDKAQKASKSLSKSVSGVIQGLGKNGLVGALGAVGLASSGLTATLGSVVKIAKQVSKTIGECTEAYKTQLIAERALNTAIQNNPFVTGASTKALKQFASEMQKVSNYGDEELLPMMTNLISLGRTEAETMQIMSVAMDMSAGMGISLDTAITQLNATLNGNIGRLGQQNAELKDLTEEELKSGKAIEILGEKFKGLSSATADTSTQLKNIKSDFKEAIGQFTLPSSDMWNKFWAGFYERGIEVINKINAFLDAQTIGKKVSGLLVEQLKPLEYYGDRIKYLRDAMHAVSDDELEALKNYLSSLSYITDDQKQILNFVEQEKDRRKDLEEIEKKHAEIKAEKAKQQEKENAELEKQKEKEKELADIRAKELENENEWADKLFAIRLENLEATRERELENEKLTQEQKIAIDTFYGDMILAMKLQQIEKEREEALKGENLTEEAKRSINLYYDNRITQAKEAEAKKRIKIKKGEGKEEEKIQKKYFEKMAKMAQDFTKKFTQIFKKVVNTIKSVFSGITNIFSKMFEFNIDEALDAVLKIEDNILTFFVETLPNMPSFLASVLQSVRVLLRNIKNIVKRDDIAKLVFSMFKMISDNLPAMISDLADIFESLVSGAIDGLVKWLDTGGFITIFNFILKVQTTIERIVTENLDKIADLLSKHIDDFADFIAQSMTSANNTLPKLIKSVLEIVVALINAIAKAFENKEFVDSIINSIKEVVKAIIEIIPELISSIVNLIEKIITAIVPYLPDLIMYLIDEISKALPSMAGTISKSLSEGVSEIFTKLFTTDFWLSVLRSFPHALSQLLKTGLNLSGSSSSGGGSGDWWNPFSSGPNIWNPLSWFADGSQSVPKGLAVVGEAGPELVKFRGGEQVLNNRNTNKALEQMGGTTINQNVTFNNLQDTTAFAMMQQLKAYNRQMAINGVI